MFLNIYEFTEDDLISNQRGFITPGQKAWLQSMAGGVVRSSRSMIPIGLGFTTLGFFLILVLFLQNDETRNALISSLNSFINLVAIIGSLLGIIGLLALGIFLAKRKAESLLNANLQSVQGVASFEENYSPNSDITGYYLNIGRKKLLFGDDPSGRFTEGREYRVHYIKAGAYTLILSYEGLS